MPDLEKEAERTLVEAATSPNTLRAREGALRYFWNWAEVALGLEVSYPVTTDTMKRFVVDHLQGLPREVDEELILRRIQVRRGPHAPATVEARVAHLSKEHRRRKLQSPLSHPIVSELLLAGRRRRARQGGQRRRTAITRPERSMRSSPPAPGAPSGISGTARF